MICENIESQLVKIFDKSEEKTILVSYLLSQLDFRGGAYKQKPRFPLVSIIRLYLFRVIKGISKYESLKKYLVANEQEAFNLGFYKSDNNYPDLPPKRTYNHYLQTCLTADEKHQLDLIADKIVLLVSEKGIALDVEIAKPTKDKNKSRILKERRREATRLVKKLVYPLIDLKIKNNGKFTPKDLLDVLVHVATTHDFANNGAATFEEQNPDRKTPSGDLMFYHFHKFDSVIKLRDMFDRILDVIFSHCKRNYNVLNNSRKFKVAYDTHEIPYYGDKTDNYVCGGKHKDGTNNFFKFLTCSIVVAGHRFIIDVVPIHQLNSLENLLDKSLTKVKSKIKIDMAYFDRGFDKSKIINVIKKHNIKYVMPKIKSYTVKAWFDKSSGIESRVIKDFQIGKGDNKAIVNLVLVDDENGVKRAFICNFDIAPCLAYRLYKMYSKRWGIETSYRNLDHDFKPRTTTKNYNIRLFYFLFSCCLYNLWVLVNICVSLAIHGKISEKPIITAKMFAILLYKVQAEYWDDGG